MKLRSDLGETATSSTTTGTAVSQLRVLPKLSPPTRGALKLARRFSDALVCVRHRGDDRGEYRYTTVELVVERVPVQPRAEMIVWLKVAQREHALQAMVKAAGGRWDPTAMLWRLPKRVATILRLSSRVVPK